jgi:N-methylhydantoinase B
MPPKRIDPITLEVIGNGLGSIVDEMALTVMRTAFSSLVKDAMDYSTAFCDAKGEVIAQGLTIVLHLGSFPSAVNSILSKYAGAIYPGDVFVMNDPYGSGGIHLPDIFVIKPVFYGDEIEGFSCVVAHQTDIGGIVPGSNSTHSTEIYQEGLRIPTLKLYERGRPNETLFEIIRHNVRVPVKVLGDIRAEIAAAATGERGFLQLVDRYGIETARRSMQELADYAERMSRSEISSLADGTYEFTSYIDGDNIPGGDVVIQVSLTIRDDCMIVDFTGSSGQVKAGINSPLPYSESATYGAIRQIMDPAIPNALGFARPIEVIAPAASVVNPVLPAPCGARGITGFRIMDAVLGALAQAVPDRVPADGEGGNSIISIGGHESDRGPFAFVDLFAGGRGGRPNADGPEGVPHPGSNGANTPVEVAEYESPIRIEEYGFLPDTGGAGRFRGALSVTRKFRCLADEAVLQLRSDKRKHLPYGLNGGKPGTPSWNILNPGEGQEIIAPMGVAPMKYGDLIYHIVAGGAGWGDPLDREPGSVLNDVLDEKMTLDHVRREYGVIINPATFELDLAATEERRKQMRSSS